MSLSRGRGTADGFSRSVSHPMGLPRMYSRIRLLQIGYDLPQRRPRQGRGLRARIRTGGPRPYTAIRDPRQGYTIAHPATDARTPTPCGGLRDARQGRTGVGTRVGGPYTWVPCDNDSVHVVGHDYECIQSNVSKAEKNPSQQDSTSATAPIQLLFAVYYIPKEADPVPGTDRDEIRSLL